MDKRLWHFYGWVIVGLSVVSMTLLYGVRHSFSVFFPSILDEFGWSRASTSVILSIHIFCYGILAPFAGNLGDSWKPRRIMPIGAVVLGLAAASCGLASRLWHFYIIFGIFTPLGLAFCGWPMFSPALANWFVKKRGLALAIGQIGGGMSFVYSMFAEFLISRLGWRYAFLIIGAVLTGILVPLYLLFFYYHPREKGLAAYGDDDMSEGIGSNESRSPNRPNRRITNLLKTPRLWLFIFSQFSYWGVGCYLILAHQIKFAEDAGFSSMFAASIFALYGLFMIAGQLSSSISDWIGRELTIALSIVLSLIAVGALLLTTDASRPFLLYVYAVCLGYGAGLFSPTIFVGAADIFHGPRFGLISGLMLSGMGMGGAIGPWIGGYLYDATGNYFWAFLLCGVCFLLAGIAFVLAAPRHAVKIQARIK